MASQLNVYFGSLLGGSLFNWGLQGALTIQVYIYHMCFPRDPMIYKLSVYAICIYEWIQTGLITADIYQVILSFNSIIAELDSYAHSYAYIAVFAMTAFISAIVQCYYSWRIFKLSDSSSKVVPVLICLMALMQLVSGLISAVDTKLLSSFPVYTKDSQFTIPSFAPSVIVWLAGSAMTDIVIASAMVVRLSKFKKKSSIPTTNKLVSRLIILVLETGSMTAIVSLLTVVLFALNSNLVHCPIMILSKLYVNSLLICLINRAFITRDDDGHIITIQTRQLDEIVEL